jgi:RNA polymerase sigma-70 factor (ECF subfamily)
MNDLSVMMDEMNDLDVLFGPEDRGFVYAVARRIVGSREDADDVTQEALLLAYRYRDTFRGESKYRTWLYRIASTTALGLLRKRRRSREELMAVPIDRPDGARSQEDELAEAESIDLIQRSLRRLAPKYRDVMLARADWSEAETAAKLGISVANVKVRAHRARKQLKELIEIGQEAI